MMTPALPDERLLIYPNLKLYALRFGAVLEVAQFNVVRNQFCPYMSSLGPGTFYSYSQLTSIAHGTLI